MKRLQKIIAESGAASRRKAEEMIASGRVAVNGNIVREMGVKAAEGDIVTLDGVALCSCSKLVYIMLNKPQRVISSAKEQFGRKTVVDLVNYDVRLFPVGRLDYDTTGLIILTNDGEFAHRLTHPKNKIKKTYTVSINRVLSDKDIDALRNGVMIDEKMTNPAEVVVLSPLSLQITISEGRNRQIRKMLAAVNAETISLQRISIGNLRLGNLPTGKWRHLTSDERQNLF